MAELRDKVKMEIHHHISPVIGWLRSDAAKGIADWDRKRLDQWEERAGLAVDAIMDHVGEVEYEYNIEVTDKVTGKSHLYRDLWEPVTGWLERKKPELDGYSAQFTHRMVKRRKAGPIQDA